MTIDREIGTFTPEQASALWRDYMDRQAPVPLNMPAPMTMKGTVYDVSTHRVAVRNTSDEVIPPYACMRVTGAEVDAGMTVLNVERPSSTTGEFVFNSQYEIPIATETEPGVGWAYRYGVVVMRGQAGEVSANTAYTPVVDEWHIEPGAGPFTIFGRHHTHETSLIGRFTVGGDGGSGPSGTGACCGTVYARGSVTWLGVEWAETYRIDYGGDIGVIEHVYQGSGVWESDTIEVTCDGGTDEYVSTMTATSVEAGGLKVVVEMETGGGYLGESACCESEPLGFRWEFRNG